MANLPSPIVDLPNEKAVAPLPASPVTEFSLDAFTDDTDFSDPSFVDITGPPHNPMAQTPVRMNSITGIGEADCTRHAELYMNEGMVEIRVQHTLYRVPAYALVRDSEYFRSLLKDRVTSDVESGIVVIEDEDVTSVDFERFLRLLFPRVIGQYAATTCEEWTSILHLATKWAFAAIRELALSQVYPLATDIERIVLGRKYGMEEWLLDAFVAVCSRPEPLSLSEARRMSLEDVVRIGQGYASIRPKASILGSDSVRTTIQGIVQPTTSKTVEPATSLSVAQQGAITVPESLTLAADKRYTKSLVLPDALLEFAVKLPDRQSWRATHIGQPGWGYVPLPTSVRDKLCKNVRDLLDTCIHDAVHLKYIITLIINEGVASSNQDATFSSDLAQLCYEIPSWTQANIGAQVIHRDLFGRDLALQYIHDACEEDIMSWTRPDLGGAQASQSVIFAHQFKTLTFLMKLNNARVLPSSLAPICCASLVDLQSEPSLAQLKQLDSLLCLAGRILDTPETCTVFDKTFRILAHLRLDTRYSEVHQLIVKLIEQRKKGWV